MTLQGMLGVFILLVVSAMVGLFILIIEWIYASAKDSRKQVNVSRTCFVRCLRGPNSVLNVRALREAYQVHASFDPGV